MSPFQLSALALVGLAGPCVVLVREPRKQLLVSGTFGLALSLFFLAFRAPDVALSQLVVGAFATPLMVMLALARVHRGKRP